MDKNKVIQINKAFHSSSFSFLLEKIKPRRGVELRAYALQKAMDKNKVIQINKAFHSIISFSFLLQKVKPRRGVEPRASALQVLRSNQLS